MRRKKAETGQARLLDHWSMPPNAGDPVGCITTSFTFQADFFEEECLPRFLGMESNEEDGPVYFIEREEKLNSVDCVSVWVDQHHVQQLRNMRWDLISFRIKQGIFHAKVSVLRWSNHIRILIGSANMTESGYRKNREIMVALDLNQDSHADKYASIQVMEAMMSWLTLNTNSSREVSQRSEKFLRDSISFTRRLPDPKEGLRNNEYLAFPVMIQPGQPSMLEKTASLWKVNFGEVGPSEAHVVSPFFDTSADINLATDSTVAVLRKKGPRRMLIYTSGEADQKGKPYRLNAPATIYKNSDKYGSNVSFEFFLINPVSEVEKGYRSLHTKSYWLEGNNGDYIYLSGSSNFTAKGLGLIPNSNIEANIALVSNSRKYPKTLDLFLNTWLENEIVDPDLIKWQPVPSEDVATESSMLLPDFFKSATLKKNDNALVLEIEFTDAESPDEFDIKASKGDELWHIVNNNEWAGLKNPLIWKKEIPEKNLPSYLLVYWNGQQNPAVLPINIENQDCLPPPEELKDLPLDVLTELITSAKPLHSVLRKYLTRKSKVDNVSGEIIDPLKKYSSSTYLLQRTRKYSIAINQFRDRLEAPFPTQSSLEWRLNGPVGMMAAVDAILRESKSKSEAVFFLSEIWKTLGKVKPRSAPGCLSLKSVMERVTEFRQALLSKLYTLWDETENPHITNYSKYLVENY
jgi:HKD family nuclease